MANRTPITPPINTEGFYVTVAPFELPSNVVYHCTAIRTFPELRTRGIDVYKTYYAPKSLSTDTYEADARVGAAIVTLVSSDNVAEYVPNTYIESYPGMSGVYYDHKVIVLELGMLPRSLNIDYILPELKDVITRHVGVTSDPEYVTVPYRGDVTHQQHVDLETARRATITSHVTLKEENTQLKSQVEALNAQNAQLVEVINDLQPVP